MLIHCPYHDCLVEIDDAVFNELRTKVEQEYESNIQPKEKPPLRGYPKSPEEWETHWKWQEMYWPHFTALQRLVANSPQAKHVVFHIEGRVLFKDVGV